MTKVHHEWDLFISHASEDKDAFVRPLANALRLLGVSVWYDEFSLRPGDSLSRSIDEGLAKSRFGLVVVSPSFIAKAWPERELRGLVAREVVEGRVIIPIWFGVTRTEVLDFSPPLADAVAIRTEGVVASDVAIQVLREVRPDLYDKHPRAELERRLSGETLRELQCELDRFRCPRCGAPLVALVGAPTDPDENDWDERKEFECGFTSFGGAMERPCPCDPMFPKLEDFELESFEAEPARWVCYPYPKTDMARTLHIDRQIGRTREEAEQLVREEYARHASRRQRRYVA